MYSRKAFSTLLTLYRKSLRNVVVLQYFTKNSALTKSNTQYGKVQTPIKVNKHYTLGNLTRVIFHFMFTAINYYYPNFYYQ